LGEQKLFTRVSLSEAPSRETPWDDPMWNPIFLLPEQSKDEIRQSFPSILDLPDRLGQAVHLYLPYCGLSGSHFGRHFFLVPSSAFLKVTSCELIIGTLRASVRLTMIRDLEATDSVKGVHASSHKRKGEIVR
jgi:hypothetical protein